MDNNLATFLRMLLAAVASFIIGKTFWGTPLTTEFLDTAIATVLEVVALVWALRAHTVAIEKLQATVRNFVVLAAGFFVSRGIISAEASISIVGAAVALATWIYSRLSKIKTEQLQRNQINVNMLKGTTR